MSNAFLIVPHRTSNIQYSNRFSFQQLEKARVKLSEAYLTIHMPTKRIPNVILRIFANAKVEPNRRRRYLPIRTRTSCVYYAREPLLHHEDVLRLLWSITSYVSSVGYTRSSRETQVTSLPWSPSRLWSETEEDITGWVTSWITSCINAPRHDGSESFMIHIVGSSGLYLVAE